LRPPSLPGAAGGRRLTQRPDVTSTAKPERHFPPVRPVVHNLRLSSASAGRR
jgi:hypothetical protein